MSKTYPKGGACLAALLTVAMAGSAAAQPQGGYPNPPPPQGYSNPPPNSGYPGQQGGGQGYSEPAPPQGEYAPPPSGSDQNGGNYDDQQQQADAAYADAYARWSAQYCVNQANNTVAGALIGGILGAGIGAAVTHNPATGAAIGGAIGAGTGAVAGSSYGGGGCPPGFVVAAGAPAFVYAGPYYAWAPAWYHPWVWAGGRWAYHPYRSWYWAHRAYWRPGWRARPGRWRRW